ncbi:MAG TPA: hypothetical protein VD997_13475 [Phycisphaerales bacterium]|nr:hypothetical protein [Phycisphaerales bacterium]
MQARTIGVVSAGAVVVLAGRCLGQGAWELVSSPSPGATVNSLRAVSAVSAGEAWAVGASGGTVTLPLVLRFDGAWAAVAPPSFRGMGINPSLIACAASPAGTLWLGGDVDDQNPLTSNRPVFARRSGSGWVVSAATLRPQSEYPYGARGGSVADLCVISDSDVWAVGHANGFGDGLGTGVTMALHFDGSTWTDVPMPNPANRTTYVTGVKGFSSSNVWAVGYGLSNGQPWRGFVFRWNGSAWSTVSNPATDGFDTYLRCIDGVAPDDLWAAGKTGSAPLFMHYDGSSWSVVPGPVSASSATVTRLVALASDDVWAATALPSVYYHWNGSVWSEVQPGAVPTAASRVVNALTRVPGGGAWAVGNWSNGTKSFTLTERLVAAPACGTSDFNGDGDAGTDQDIEAFFACLGGSCCAWCYAGGADFNGDGDTGTDQDIESFFRVLGGGSC